MSTGMWTVSFTVVYAVEPGTASTLDVVTVGDPFDVLAPIRVGQSWMEVVDSLSLFVAVRDLSRGDVVARGTRVEEPRPRRRALAQTLAVGVDEGWKADDGDVLELLATLKVTAGLHTSYATARSGPLVASTDLGGCAHGERHPDSLT